MTDPFEARVAEALRTAARPDAAEIARLRDFAESVPARRQLPPTWLAAATMAVAAGLVLFAVGLGWLRPAQSSGPPTYPIQRSDPRFGKCFGNAMNVIAAFPMDHASDYLAYIPRMGKSPELATSAPAFVVVYAGRFAGPVLPAPFRSGGAPYQLSSLSPGHHDLCVWVGDLQHGDFTVYGDVDTTGMNPNGPPVGTRQYAIHYPPAVNFDYPASWRIIQEGVEAGSYRYIAVVLGTGDWKLNGTLGAGAKSSSGCLSCGPDIFTLAPGEIVVEMYTLQGPEPIPHAPPPTAILLPNGWRATVEDSATSSTWQVYVPGWLYPLTIDARFADPGGDDARAAVKRTVESLRLATTPAASAAP